MGTKIKVNSFLKANVLVLNVFIVENVQKGGVFINLKGGFVEIVGKYTKAHNGIEVRGALKACLEKSRGFRILSSDMLCNNN